MAQRHQASPHIDQYLLPLGTRHQMALGPLRLPHLPRIFRSLKPRALHLPLSKLILHRVLLPPSRTITRHGSHRPESPVDHLLYLDGIQVSGGWEREWDDRVGGSTVKKEGEELAEEEVD